MHLVRAWRSTALRGHGVHMIIRHAPMAQSHKTSFVSGITASDVLHADFFTRLPPCAGLSVTMQLVRALYLTHRDDLLDLLKTKQTMSLPRSFRSPSRLRSASSRFCSGGRREDELRGIQGDLRGLCRSRVSHQNSLHRQPHTPYTPSAHSQAVATALAS